MNCNRSSLVVTILLTASIATAQYSIPPANLTNVNTIYSESGPCLSPDGLTLYFTSDRPDGQGNLDLWHATRPDLFSPFDEASNLGATLNGSSHDAHPWISTDGLTLMFASARSGGEGNYDLWISSRVTTDDAFGYPSNLGEAINTPYRESRPCLSSDGLDLYFTSDRPGGEGDYDLWVASRPAIEDAFGLPVNLGPGVNTPYRDGGAGISADGTMLYFNSAQPGNIGSADIYLATRSSLDDPFSDATNLGDVINSPAGETAATLSADGTILIFSSGRSGGVGGSDLWMATVPEPATMSLLALGGVALLKRRK